MDKYHAAVDIGASSGRLILGEVNNGIINLEEIHRFENGLNEENGHLCWDTQYLFGEILTGLKKCKAIGKTPATIGVDTWGVDFVLLDENDVLIGQAVGYRDSRNKGMDEEVYKIISEADLYARTGIQKAIYNTIYQLMAVKRQNPNQLENAKALLMMPDYMHFLLTGKKASEYTIATTSQLINPNTKSWDYELIDMLGYPKEVFQEIKVPGTSLGNLRKEVSEEIGFDCEVILPGSHDTASAVLAVPSNEKNTLYISSGTWSLMGVEAMKPDCSKESHALNFTNEGGYNYRFRYLKNIMGLWMIQNVKKELEDKYSFVELCQMAENSDCDSIVDCNDIVFLAPESMMMAVSAFCTTTGQKVPKTAADYARVIYRSLAKCYKKTLEEIESIQKVKYKTLYVVGGGSNAAYLNELTAYETNLTVSAGPAEATAIGNILVQMLAKDEYESLEEARGAIGKSFDIKIYN
ncbi:rhamnulokinase [Pseudobutyrivibrio sp.]|uniref:rhamnulokinase n=1 Tax=Pseudobutyrivibrio sp. TaxID=2014367 RepID=UPI0038664B18